MGAWFSRLIMLIRLIMPVTFQLVLVRHGETEANRDKIIQGQLDTTLSEVGRDQARMVAKRLAGENFFRRYTSDLVRAAETAEVIVAATSSSSSPPSSSTLLRDRRLRERCFGAFEGLSISQFLAAAHHNGVAAVTFTPPGGGESLEEVRERAANFFHSLCKDCARTSSSSAETSCSPSPLTPSQSPASPSPLTPSPASPAQPSSPSVLVVSHGGLIRTLIEHFQLRFGCALPRGALRTTPNTAVSSFTVAVETEPEVKCVSVQMVYIHDTSHLQ